MVSSMIVMLVQYSVTPAGISTLYSPPLKSTPSVQILVFINKFDFNHKCIPMASVGEVCCASNTTATGSDNIALGVRHTSTVPLFSGVTYSSDVKEIVISVHAWW